MRAGSLVAHHPYASVPVPIAASTCHQRLTVAPEVLVRDATADALASLAPTVRSWGFEPGSLPHVTARRTPDDGLGAVDLRWDGLEERTGWPAMTATLLVTPSGEGTSELAFVASRAPARGLATSRLDRLHGERVVHLAVQGFLRGLADRLTPGAVRSLPRPPGPGRGSHAPLFLHDLRRSPHPPEQVRRRLSGDPDGLVARATAVALERTVGLVAGGRFRAPARPLVAVRGATDADLALLHVHWSGDEEATGWPSLVLHLVGAAARDGSTLAVLSRREPRYDLSRNRVDKHVRDRLLRAAVTAFLAAVGAELDAPDAADLAQEVTPTPPRTSLVR